MIVTGIEKIVQQLVDRYDGKVDGIFHCGDSELSIDDPLVAKLHIVQGNMDLAAFPDHDVETIDGQTILVTHGHHQNVNGGLLNLELYACSWLPTWFCLAILTRWARLLTMACCLSIREVFLSLEGSSQSLVELTQSLNRISINIRFSFTIVIFNQ